MRFQVTGGWLLAMICQFFGSVSAAEPYSIMFIVSLGLDERSITNDGMILPPWFMVANNLVLHVNLVSQSGIIAVDLLIYTRVPDINHSSPIIRCFGPKGHINGRSLFPLVC